MFRWVDHTAELELELEAGSPEEVLSEALEAFAGLLDEAEGDALEVAVSLDAPDLPALLVAWLEELVYLADAEGLVPGAAEIQLDGHRLEASVRGRRGTPRPLVKAVTYHRAELARADGRWRGRVVLDV